MFKSIITFTHDDGTIEYVDSRGSLSHIEEAFILPTNLATTLAKAWNKECKYGEYDSLSVDLVK